MRVLLLSEDRWPAYWSLAAAPALQGRYAFAFMPARAAQDVADKFGVDLDPAGGSGEGARVVVVVRRDGSYATKTGVQNRKALTRFLLKNQWELVPQVSPPRRPTARPGRARPPTGSRMSARRLRRKDNGSISYCSDGWVGCIFQMR